MNGPTGQLGILVLGSKGNWRGCLIHEAGFASIPLKRINSGGCKLADHGAVRSLWIC